MLFAVAVPPASPLGGGQTEFADMRAAYDALDDDLKATIDGLVVEHDIFWSRGADRLHRSFPPGEREKMPIAPARLVRRHPGSGRKTLYNCLRMASAWSAGRSPTAGCCSSDLNLHATQRQFVYSHNWRVGDLVIWDNRCTMHRGRPYDDTQPRDLRQGDNARSRLDPGRGGVSYSTRRGLLLGHRPLGGSRAKQR